MGMKNLIYAGLMMFLLVSCGREKIDEHDKFIGEWYGSDEQSRYYEILIEDNGDCYYYREGFAYVERTGSFWVNKAGDKVKIAGKKFDLEVYPMEMENDEWYMKIDDIELYSTK